ncbi:MAG: hypothetical protein KDI44_07580 [Thiothrix sp.]|nr:hypothetical protein [Thiothrix sp.]HPQ95797.1 hypothetical protein [Thiolinea sp.]
MEFLYQQLPAAFDDGDTVNLFFRQQDAMLAPVPPCNEMEKHWGINTIDVRLNSAVKIHFRTGLEDGALEGALIDKGAIPAGETFDLVRWIGPGVGFKGLAWSIQCAAENCIEFDIEVVKVDCATGEETTLQTVEGVKAWEGAWAKQDWLAKPEGIEGGQIALLKLKFKTLPYVDAAGNQFWGDDCNPVPCLGIDIHALTEDTCMRRELLGCGTSCCNPMPCSPCEQKQITKSC